MDERLEKWLKELQGMANEHLHVMQLCITADNSNMFTTDLLAGAAINRSLSNIQGFIAMMRNNNYLLAGSIVRLQLDTLLRFFALHLVEKPASLADEILSGKKLSKMRCKEGHHLTDAYLCKKFTETENLPWVMTVYERTSGLIHLSRGHIAITMHSEKNDPERMLRLTIGEKANIVSYEDQEELTQCIIHITELIITYIYGWVKTKESFPARRTMEAT